MESVSVLKTGDNPNENARNKIRLFKSSFTKKEIDSIEQNILKGTIDDRFDSYHSWFSGPNRS